MLCHFFFPAEADSKTTTEYLIISWVKCWRWEYGLFSVSSGMSNRTETYGDTNLLNRLPENIQRRSNFELVNMSSCIINTATEEMLREQKWDQLTYVPNQI